MTLLLQSPIRCSDKPAAGGLAHRAFDVLHEYASGPPGSGLTTRRGDFATNGHESCGLLGAGFHKLLGVSLVLGYPWGRLACGEESP